MEDNTENFTQCLSEEGNWEFFNKLFSFKDCLQKGYYDEWENITAIRDEIVGICNDLKDCILSGLRENHHFEFCCESQFINAFLRIFQPEVLDDIFHSNLDEETIWLLKFDAQVQSLNANDEHTRQKRNWLVHSSRSNYGFNVRCFYGTIAEGNLGDYLIREIRNRLESQNPLDDPIHLEDIAFQFPDLNEIDRSDFNSEEIKVFLIMERFQAYVETYYFFDELNDKLRNIPGLNLQPTSNIESLLISPDMFQNVQPNDQGEKEDEESSFSGNTHNIVDFLHDLYLQSGFNIIEDKIVSQYYKKYKSFLSTYKSGSNIEGILSKWDSNIFSEPVENLEMNEDFQSYISDEDVHQNNMRETLEAETGKKINKLFNKLRHKQEGNLGYTVPVILLVNKFGFADIPLSESLASYFYVIMDRLKLRKNQTVGDWKQNSLRLSYYFLTLNESYLYNQ